MSAAESTVKDDIMTGGGSKGEVVFVYVGTLDYRGRLLKEIATLAGAGFSCRLVLGNIGERRVDPDKFAFPVEEHAVPAFKGRLRCYLETLRFGWRVGRQLAASGAGRVFCLGLEALPAGIVAKRMAPGTRVIFDSNELHLESYMSRIKRWLWAPIQRAGIRAADVILHAEPNRMEYFKGVHGGSGKPQAVIENFPRLHPRHDPDGRFAGRRVRVLYLGALGKDRFTSELVEIGKALEDRASLDLVGFATPEVWEELERCHGLRPSEHVRILPPVAYEEIPALLEQYDVGIALYMHTNLNNYYCAPNKVYDYLMAGMPVITNRYPGLERVIDEGGLGACVDAVDTPSFAAALDRIVEGGLWRNITDEVRRRYSWEQQEGRLVELVEGDAPAG